jgi:hypothetical protein
MSEIAAPADIVSDIINDRIAAHLVTPAYQQIVGLVITALEERDEAIADLLRQIGSEQGLDPRKVEAALVEVGLSRLSDPQATNGSDAGGTPVSITLDAWAEMLGELDGIKSRVSRLEEVARRAGVMVLAPRFMGRPVGD